MKFKTDTLVAVVLLLASIVFLVQRKLGYLAVWLLLITGVIGYGVRMPLTFSVILGIISVIGVVLITGEALREQYENPSKSDEKKEKEPEAHSAEPEEHHIDAGTTILHAFQKLNPQQVLQMRDDTKELMETQKQLVETLASLGPQIKQGAQLVQSFQTMFGGNLSDMIKAPAA